MLKFILVAGLFGVMIACNNSEEANELAEDVVTNCDCNDLQYDPGYNNFYMEKPREGYTGKCEIFHANGQLALSKNFKDGKVDGDMISFYENGQINEKKTFDKNFQTGEGLKYSEDGTLIFKALYDYGREMEIVIGNSY
jgi:antitoxin component YwqK of YwqJK toxin-antitoxin module